MTKRLNNLSRNIFILVFYKKALLYIVVLFLCLYSGSLKAAEKSYGDAFVVGSSSDAVTLMPFLSTDTVSGSVNSLVFNGLTKLDKNLEITGDLAESWQISDDKLSLTFYLKDNIYWQDGVKFTAEDVKFTYDVILDPANAAPYAASFKDLESIRVVDDNTIEFKFSEPYAPVLHKLGTEIIPKHLLEGKDLRQTPFARAPLGTGAYTFKEWRADQYIILNSNHNYFEGRPHIDRYVMRVIPDEPVQYLELITGGIDYTGLSPYQYKYRTDTDKFKSNFNKYKYLARSYTYVGYNLEEPLFKEKEVRQALSYALNKKDIIQGALLGLGEVCTGPFLKGTYAYDESVEGYPYNPDKARALLKEAGWQDTDGDGILDKDGENFSFRLILSQGNMQRQQVATIIQQQWKDIGIEVEIRSVAWATFLKEFVDKRNYQALILGWTTPVDPDIYNVWHSDSTKEGGLNFMNYKNTEVDKLIEEGRRTFNQAERAEIYKKIHAIISEDAPYTFLYTPYALPAVHKRFKGIEPAPAGIFYNFIDWHVNETEQKYVW